MNPKDLLQMPLNVVERKRKREYVKSGLLTSKGRQKKTLILELKSRKVLEMCGDKNLRK